MKKWYRITHENMDCSCITATTEMHLYSSISGLLARGYKNIQIEVIIEE